MSSSTPRQLKESVVLITGASQGIGRALALLLAHEHGAHVYACARSADDLAELSALAPGHVHAVPLDVRDGQALDEFFVRIKARHGRLDALINNASVLGPIERLEEIEDEAWAHVLSVNLNGSFFVTKRALPLLRRSDPGLIVHMSSSVGRKTRATWGAYSISKYALEGLSALIVDEEDASSVVSVTLNPGGTATQMRADAYPDEDPSTLPTPELVARTIALLLEWVGPEQSGHRYTSRDLFSILDAHIEDGSVIPHE